MQQATPIMSLAPRRSVIVPRVLATFIATATLAGCNSGPGAAPGPGPGTPWGQPAYGSGMMMGGNGMMMGHGMMAGHGMIGQASMLRHRQAMMGGVPAPYRGLTDPLPGTPAVVAAGRDLYAANCAACHGPLGVGDGPAGSALSPPPANLRALVQNPMARDDYLMWAIAAGGAEFGTAMPTFKDTLSDDARWKIVRYLRTL